MQLTKQTDFSMRILIYLAQFKEPRRTQIQELCEYFDISSNHLSKLVMNLSSLGYVDTRRGKGGGLSLAKLPSEINIAELIKQVEPNLKPVNCKEPVCRISPDCKLRGMLDQAMQAFIDAMACFTLQDLIISEERFIELRTLTVS